MSPAPLLISLGDPAGIGPEVVVKALARRPAVPVTIFGDAGVLAVTAQRLGLPGIPAASIRQVTSLSHPERRAGHPTEETGAAQVAYLEAATDALLGGEARALVTAPLSKQWAHRAGFAFPGHTEYLAHRAATQEFAMMLAGPVLKVTVATTHLALRDVPYRLSVESLARAIYLTARSMERDFLMASPQVAVAGLNPHAGEGGQFGDEELTLVEPAIAQARLRLKKENLNAEIWGPLIPDAVFRQAAEGRFHAVVALYHDQGLIPIKLLHFDEAVNVTLGLPFIRTSPDHGTAYDIAGTGRARETSFLAALDLAAHLLERRVTSPSPKTQIL